MRKYVLLSVIYMFIFSTYSRAQELKEGESHPLTGIWQQSIVVQNPTNPAEERRIFKTHNLKFLNEDGTFFNMVVSDQKQISNITVLGTYEVNSDENYTEIIEKSYTNPNDINRKVKLGYKLSNENKHLVISYFSISPKTGVSEMVEEFWVKIEGGNPFIRKDNQKSQEQKNTID